MNHASSDRLRAERHAAAQLLLRCAREDGELDAAVAQRLLNAADASTVVELATFHRIGGLAYEHLRKLSGADPVLLDALGAQFAANVTHHLRTLGEIARLQPILDATGVPWAVVKGPAAVELLYGAAGLRSYRDLDILVHPSGLRSALMALEDGGARVFDRSWTMLRREMRGELHLVLASGSALDLHWKLIDARRGAMLTNTDDVLGRTVRIDLGGVSVPTLDAADSAVHMAVHASLSGGDRLGWLKDLERTAAVRPPDWNAVVDRARRWNVALPTGLVLSRAEMVLGAKVPARTVRELLGRRAARLIRAIDRRWPPQRASGGRTPARLLARVIGHGFAGGAALVVERSVAHLRRERGLAAAYRVGDGHEREAFLEAVAGSAEPA